jgi:tetratricopeptide (TPR) repeat protein
MVLTCAIGAVVLLLSVGCSESPEEKQAAAPKPVPAGVDIPTVNADDLEPRVAELLSAHRDAVVESPTSHEAWGAYAAALDAHEMYGEAEIAYERARELSPRDFRWTYLLATVAEIRGGDPGRVRALLEKAAAMEPGYATVHYRLGDVLARSGDTAEAADAYRRALHAAPDFHVARRELGQMLLRLGSIQEARGHLERVLNEAPDDRATLSALVQATIQLGDAAASDLYAARVRDLDEAINVSNVSALRVPDPLRFQLESIAVSSRACDERASRLMAEGKFAEAVENLKIVLETRPDDASTHLRLGSACLGLGEVETSADHLARAVALEPDSHAAHLMLGSLLLAADLSEQALRHLDRAVELNAESVIAHTRRARAFRQLGRWEEALASYREAVRLNPGSAELARELAEAEGAHDAGISGNGDVSP